MTAQERNQLNASHSTGPRTPEGKAKVSQNARKLGLFVSDTTIAQECPEEFADLLAGYIADYNPLGTIEMEFVRQLTAATWRLRRIERMETVAYDSDDLFDTRHEASLNMSEKFKEEQVFFDRIYRARQQAERTFNRVYKELEARKARRLTERETPEALEIEIDTRHTPLPQNKATFDFCAPADSSPVAINAVMNEIKRELSRSTS
jgi:hypothetical protein